METWRNSVPEAIPVMAGRSGLPQHSMESKQVVPTDTPSTPDRPVRGLGNYVGLGLAHRGLARHGSLELGPAGRNPGRLRSGDIRRLAVGGREAALCGPGVLLRPLVPLFQRPLVRSLRSEPSDPDGGQPGDRRPHHRGPLPAIPRLGRCLRGDHRLLGLPTPVRLRHLRPSENLSLHLSL